MITRIELVNFMSHEHTVIEPSTGLTVLVGPNNCGKSAVVAALQILAHNHTSTHVMRHGERETRITVHTAEGDEVTWRRTKSGSPSYTVNGRLFDRLNRQVPEEVRKALRLNTVTAGPEAGSNEFDLHFGEQKAPVFLIDLPNTQAAQFFASSSDAIHLVEMQRRHKLRIRDARQERTRAQAELEAVDAELEALTPLDGIEERISAAEELHGRIQEGEREVSELERALAQFERAERDLEQAVARREALEPLSVPPALEDTRDLERISERVEQLSRERSRADAEAAQLADLHAAPSLEDTAGIRKLVEDLSRSARERDHWDARVRSLARIAPIPAQEDPQELETLITGVERLRQELNRAESDVAEAAQELSRAREDVRAWAESHGTCPTCGAPLSGDRLVQLLERGMGGHSHEQ